jgi:hypothetical protein
MRGVPFVVVVASTLLTQAVLAECDCAGVSLKESFKCHDAVFVGRIVSGNVFPVSAEVAVLEVFKGRLPDTIEVGANFGCHVSLAEGGTYLFEAFKGEDGGLQTSQCSFTRLVEEPGTLEQLRLIRRRAWWWRSFLSGWCRHR